MWRPRRKSGWLERWWLKPVACQLVANGRHTILSRSIARKQKTALLHHADGRYQSRQCMGDHHLPLRVREGPADQGAHGFCAIAIPLMRFQHAVSNFHYAISRAALEAGVPDQIAGFSANAEPQSPPSVVWAGLFERLKKALLGMFVVQRWRPDLR